MSNSTTIQAGRIPAAEGRGLKIALLVIATAQLMLVLDDSISNIALPSIQADLNISASNLPWVINAYILAFGALLLFGGKLGDLWGRKRILQAGIALFTVASFLAGLSQNFLFLIVARSVQGLGAAMAAPNALALIATTFPQGAPRNKALAVYGAMSGLGIVIGLFLGGILTSTLGWRWVYFITVPIGIGVLAGSRRLVDAERHAGKLDILGAITGTFGMAALVYAITRGGEHGWQDTFTLMLLIAAVIMLLIFIVSQARGKDPMLPLSLFKDRNRSVSYLGMVFLAFGPMGAFYLITLYMQIVLRFSAFQTGLAWIPFAIGLVLGSGITSKLVAKFPPRNLTALGMLITGGSMLWLSAIGENTGYAGHIMPAVFALAFGFAMSFIPLTLTAVNQVLPQQSGIASALLNSSQQIGTALGLAVLSSVAVTVTDQQLPDALSVLHLGHETQNSRLISTVNTALINGYSAGLLVGAITLFIIALISFIFINAKVRQSENKGLDNK